MGTLTRETTDHPVPAPSSPDLAVGRPVWAASSEQPYLGPEFAADGRTRTRWASGAGKDQWIYTALAQDTMLTGVRVDWEAAHARKYQIQTSLDGHTWTTVSTIEAGDGGVDDIALPGGPVARYVKVYAWEKGTSWNYSIWSLEVYGQPRQAGGS